DGSLPPCLITLQREKKTYGYFSAERFVHANGTRPSSNPPYPFRTHEDFARMAISRHRLRLGPKSKPAQQDQGLICGYCFGLCNPKML
ncbi:hypothetical protein LXA29_17020, partial [Erwinia amylovora]|nr:hypothetical protein [Erwinia amylovora]